MRLRLAMIAALGVATSLAVAGNAVAAPAPGSTDTPASLAAKLRAGALTTVKTQGCATASLRLCTMAELDTGVESPIVGYGPRELQARYGVQSTATADDVRTGPVIAIVSAGLDPTIEPDLNKYLTQFGLPSCTADSGCLTIEGVDGGPRVNEEDSASRTAVYYNFATETTIDVEMAAGLCPSCKILLLTANAKDGVPQTSTDANLAVDHFATAAQTAFRSGAKALNVSYGFPAYPHTMSAGVVAKMNTPGMAITASTGDSGASNAVWPAVLSTVTAVGGTSLSKGTDGNYHETAWSRGGSFCAPAGSVSAPPYQPPAANTACSNGRAASDISAVGDPQTGVATYCDPDSCADGGWQVWGGTSVSAPIIAGLYGDAARYQLAQVPVTGANTIYSNATAASSPKYFHDVTIGQNAVPNACPYVQQVMCATGSGWDGPTGVGTPVSPMSLVANNGAWWAKP